MTGKVLIGLGVLVLLGLAGTAYWFFVSIGNAV